MGKRRLTPSSRTGVAALAAGVLLSACASATPTPTSAEAAPPAVTPSATGEASSSLRPPPGFRRLPDVVDTGSLDGESTVAGWRSVVPRIEDVRITSSADGRQQPALWLPPGGTGEQPLIVALHSWSSRWTQFDNSPYGRWADQQGWAMIAPDFRGRFRQPEATGSDLAVQDVVDAVQWAVAQGGVDADRVFVTGFSGGGMMTLLMAGRHPELFAGAVSFVPIHDLTDWYGFNVRSGSERYAREIVASCGGDPTTDESARASCDARSPRSSLDAAAEAGLPVLLAHGLLDEVVPADHSVRAFDQLAAEQDRLGEDVEAAVARGRLPADVPGEPAESFFASADPDVLLARRSGAVTLVVFDGGHDMVHHPGLAFMAALAQQRGEAGP